MKLTLAETKLLKDSVAIIADLVTEVQFTITTDTMELVAMDPANVAMVVFKLLSSAFVEFDVKEPTKIAVNLNDLKQVLRRIKPSDTITLEVANSKLKLTLKSTSKREFYLPLIEFEEREQRIPNLTFNATVTADSSTLTDAVEDVDIIGESVVFVAESKKFKVSSSNDLSKADVEIPADDHTNIQADSSIKSKYSIEYLKKMIAAAKLTDKVAIKFSKDYPLQLEYTMMDKMSLMFILAPRVDND